MIFKEIINRLKKLIILFSNKMKYSHLFSQISFKVNKFKYSKMNFNRNNNSNSHIYIKPKQLKILKKIKKNNNFHSSNN